MIIHEANEFTNMLKKKKKQLQIIWIIIYFLL